MIEETLSRIAESGLLGLLLVLALFTIWFLYQENKKERDNRLSDLKNYSSDDKKFIIEVKDILENILEIVRGSK